MKKSFFTALVIAGALVACSEESTTNNQPEAPVMEATAKAMEFANVDANSTMDWRATHLGGVQPRYGKVTISEAKVATENNTITAATAVIDMGSLTVESFGDDTEMANKLAGHLKSGDFFLVDSFAVATFQMTGITPAEGEYNATVSGNLTIKDVTKPVSFMANVNVSDNGVSIASEKFIIDRTNWNLTYNVEGTAGVPADYLIANDVEFQINLMVKK